MMNEQVNTNSRVEMPAILSLSPAARARIRELMQKGVGGSDRSEPIVGLRVGLSTKGCSGMSYEIEYAYEIRAYEEVIEDEDVRLLVDPAAVMFLIGSVMDYREEAFSSGFVFENPNEKARCGCGSSFMV